MRGPPGTEFEGGLYHFRVLLPAEYPFRPPSIMMLTPNGRFELNTKICISFTNYHEELWQPAWGVRTAIIGLQGFFPIKGQAAVGVGSIECPTSERRRLATQSRNWTCPHCQKSNVSILPDPAGALEVFAQPHSNPGQVISHAERTATSSLDDSSSVVTESSLSSLRGGEEGLPPKSTVQVGLTETVQSRDEQRNTWRTNRPPASLDAAISILLVLLFVIICRRMV
ncbi:non-canonical ubiquitin conjugating enzyme 1 [Amanita muscaria]